MNYAQLIDHTILKPEASRKSVVLLCQEAIKYGFASVCVNPYYVPLAAKLLKGQTPKVCTVIGFPLGQNTTKTKVFETKKAIKDGATEIDMVINIAALKDGKNNYVKKEIEAIAKVTHPLLLKVIIETCLLTDKEKERVCKLAVEAGADFVKTSTGFFSGGATVHDVALMRGVVGSKVGVKASGGVRTKEDLLAMVDAGANRIGTSAGPKLIN
jgi:deoxyribose-phosphate aldolase